ncbi:MAG: hypothetical protein NTV22_11295 [bacterium]|nr:hypothetical protein [bacterium]
MKTIVYPDGRTRDVRNEDADYIAARISSKEGVAVSIEGSVPAEAPAKTKRGKPAFTEPADKE